VSALPKPQAFTPPAPVKEEPKIHPTSTSPDNGGATLNITRTSEKYIPKPIDSPILLPGFGSLLTKIGIGGDAPALTPETLPSRQLLQ
jgi:hypothetical protein